MKGSNVLKLLYLFCKLFNRVFLALLLSLLLLLGVTALAFDRLVAAEIPRALPVRVTIADAQLRRNIQEVFPFRPRQASQVYDVFKQEHPDLEHFLGRGVAWGLVSWCVYLHETSRLEAIMNSLYFFDQDDEYFQGLDAACQYWLHHGLESATVDELQMLKEQHSSDNREARRRHDVKHPPPPNDEV